MSENKAISIDQTAAVPLIDEEALDLVRSMVGDAQLGPMLRLYLNDAADQASRLTAARACGSLTDAGREAHKIISSAGTMGARQVQALAVRLQTACRASDLAAALPLIDEILAASALASSEFERRLNAGTIASAA